MGPGRPLLPAHLRRRVLQHQPDAGMYSWDYVKGPRSPIAVLAATPTDGPAPADGAVLERGIARPRSGGLDHASSGTSTATGPSTRWTRTLVHLHRNGVHTARLTVTDSSGKTASANTTITVGNTSPTVTVDVPVEGGLFAFRRHHPVLGHGHATRGRADRLQPGRGDVRARPRLARSRRGDSSPGAPARCPLTRRTSRTAATLFGVVSASYTDLGGPGGVPALTTVDQNRPPEAPGGRTRQAAIRDEHRDHQRSGRWRPATRLTLQRRLERPQRACSTC